MALKRYTVIVAKNIHDASWTSISHTRLSLIDRKSKPYKTAFGSMSQQVDGMDFPTKEGIKKHIDILLKRNNIKRSMIQEVM